MIINVIIVISIIQIMLYIIVGWKTIKYARTIILFLVLTGHFVFLPRIFYPKIVSASVNCGMPVVGVILPFGLSVDYLQ